MLDIAFVNTLIPAFLIKFDGILKLKWTSSLRLVIAEDSYSIPKSVILSEKIAKSRVFRWIIWEREEEIQPNPMSPTKLAANSRDKYFKLRIADKAAARDSANGKPNLLYAKTSLSLDNFFRLEIAANKALAFSSVILLYSKFNSSSSRLIRSSSYSEIKKWDHLRFLLTSMDKLLRFTRYGNTVVMIVF